MRGHRGCADGFEVSRMTATLADAGLDAGLATLPAGSPLPMPEQVLRQGALDVRRHRTSPRMIGLRRAYLFGGTALMTAVATVMMWRVLSPNGVSVLEACLLVLFVGLFG